MEGNDRAIPLFGTGDIIRETDEVFSEEREIWFDRSGIIQFPGVAFEGERGMDRVE
ncbi:hypothetical protein BPIT_03600 [Candidatus Brocadia pituitae]|nr:hypothetical protein BPIT_03600 [Candidatus Brocadia pituitae]